MRKYNIVRRQDCRWGIVSKEGEADFDGDVLRAKHLTEALDDAHIEYFDGCYRIDARTLFVRIGFRTKKEATKAVRTLNKVKENVAYLGAIPWSEAEGYW